VHIDEGWDQTLNPIEIFLINSFKPKVLSLSTPCLDRFKP